jgi:hypothetical protein
VVLPGAEEDLADVLFPKGKEKLSLGLIHNYYSIFILSHHISKFQARHRKAQLRRVFAAKNGVLTWYEEVFLHRKSLFPAIPWSDNVLDLSEFQNNCSIK